MKTVKKVLVLGSGALKIGEAGEFDYSGSQAIKALKEEGIKTVLVNPNIATIQTSKLLADTVYFLPVNDYFVEKVIEKEKPDGIFLSFGGQTALNCGLSLYERGVLKKHNVTILGTPVATIDLTEDRKKFAEHLHTLDIPTPPSHTAASTDEAMTIANELGYPVMLRSGFSLGGQGSGIAENEKELKEITKKSFAFVKQILIEKYLHHYKEIEYEVVRDKDDNCITVCNMENMDPLGIHTGESIVIAPSQTLTNFEYHTLRSAAIKIVRSLGVIGECNVQFALNPHPKSGTDIEYFVIEMNARLSRSSALASKATGYPLAYVAAKLALGKSLTELQNKVTKATQFCFEPALDYVTVKIPRWDIDKFKGAEQTIGSSMKSVGEVMSIGRTFEEAYQKAIRMLDLDFEGPVNEGLVQNGKVSEKNLRNLLQRPTPNRIFALSMAFAKGMDVEEVYEITGIDPWFLYRVKNIVDKEKELLSLAMLNAPYNKPEAYDVRAVLTKERLRTLKELGFSDKRIGMLVGRSGLDVRALRKEYDILPSVFQIDTLAGEFPAQTNYLYMTYNGNHNDIKPAGKNAVIVLGSGPYRIGSSVEFDWTSVNTVTSLNKHGKESIIINCNPETVSTDYDISDRLYFEELTFERIADVYEFENPEGVIISVGGQTPNNRAKSLKAYGFTILGTDPDDIDRAENRTKFSALLDELHIQQPPWNKFSSDEEALAFAKETGYPVLCRPSYVLSGSNMRICHNREELEEYLKLTATISKEYPITVSKFIDNAKEIEVDCVAEAGNIKAFVISEHVENAGVHSGDASIMLPPQDLNKQTMDKLEKIARDLAKALHITGPFNIQCLAKDNTISVIEINLRSSRTFPFIAKVTGVNFIELAVDAFFHKKIKEVTIDLSKFDFVATKVAQFSFSRLTGADPVLDVEMASTGEVACFGEDLEEAFLKAELSVGGRIPKVGIFVSLGGEETKERFLQSARLLTKLNLPIYTTERTAQFFKDNGVKATPLFKIQEEKSPNVLEFFSEGKIDLAINIVEKGVEKDITDDYLIRRSAIDRNIPLFTDLKKAELFIKAIVEKKLSDLLIKSWNEYV
jgi:carbamoyl-phosphate synthase large subunit